MSMRDSAVLAKRCPQCGRLLSSDSLRCGYCLTEVWDVEADTQVEAVAPEAEAYPLLGGVRRGIGRVLALPKWLLLLVVAVLLVGGWQLYQNLQPERVLPLPASAARSMMPSSTSWSALDGDVTRTRHTDVSVSLAGATAAWQTDLGVTVGGAPVADEARLYVTTSDNRIVALNTGTGEVAWIYEAPVPISEAPVIAGARAYLLTRGGAAISLDAATGAEVWQTRLPSHFFNSPALADGVLYAFGTTEGLYGLDSEDGRLLWTIDTGADWAALAPLVVGDWIVIATGDSVDVYDRTSGSLTLEHPQSRAIGLAFHDGHVVSASSTFIARIDPTDKLPWWWGARGTWFQFWVWGLAPEPPRAGLDWLTGLRPPVPSPAPPAVYAPAFSDGAIVVANDAGLVRLLDSATGEVQWSIEVGPVTGAPVWTPDGILLPLRDALALLSPAEGRELARQPLSAVSGRSVIVTADGIFLVSDDGHIAALR